MSTVNIRVTTINGKQYKIKNKQYDKLEALITHAKDKMSNPCIYHMLSWVRFPDRFASEKRNLIKSFKRNLKKQYKTLKQEVPDTLLAYSIEFKYTDGDEIKGVNTHPTTSEQLPFLHIHFHIIADCNNCNPITFPEYARKALNDIEGLDKARYFKSNNDELYKKVKDDFADSFQRLLYIGKINQKSPEIPFRETFGASSVSI